MADDKEFYDKVEKLNESLANLTLELQNEVKELKEDTLVNAQHIHALKEKHIKSLGVVNDSLKAHIDNTGEMAGELAEAHREKEENDYTSFLKELLSSDFKALQTDMIEETKRELISVKKPPKKSKGGGNPFNTIANLLSFISFAFLVIICIKYKLLFF